LITGIGAAVNIVVNLLLIPPLGIIGAALATLASYVVIAVGLYIVTQKFYKIEYESAKMIGIFVTILLTGAIYYWLLSIDALNLFYKSFIMIFFVLINSFIAFDKNELSILKKKIFNKHPDN
jgi:O-antigen/teichoic acid export membrane protein